MPTRRTFLAAAGLAATGAQPPVAPHDAQPPDLVLPDVIDKKVRWAIVGLGKLALEELMPAFARCRLSQPTALVSGHPDNARRVAAAYGIDPRHIYSYDTFDRLRDDAEVDVVYVLRFPSGVLAHGDCSFDAGESRRLRVHGTEGFIDLDPAFSYRGLRLTVGRKGGREQPQLTEIDHFAAEMDHFSTCVLRDQNPRTPGEEGLADLRVIAAIEEAARTNRAVAVAAE